MTPQEIEELSWRMGEVYEAVVNRILVNLARHFRYIEAGEIPSGAWEYQVKKLAEMGQINRETERIILDMLGDADGALQDLLEESILNGLRDAEPALRSAAEKGFLSGGSNIPPVLAPNQMQAFKAFYAQSADKLNLVNTVMLESTQAAYAATVSDIAVRIANTQGILNVASGEVVTGVSAWNKAMRDAVNKMVDNGLTGYIDHAGRHWSPEAYVTMDIRSTMANTARAAVFERNEDYGNDLYQVSWHNGARPLCYPWQGKVISRTGNARVVEDDEGNEVQVHTEDEIESFNYGGGLFGVNCGHYPIPFIPNFSRIRQPMEDAEQNAKTYEESQKQRSLERKLRNEKRDLEVLKAQGASEDVLKEQRRRVRKASKDIDEFCAETGRARRRNREYTPIDPKFPNPDTYDPKLFPNDEKGKIDNWFRNGNDTDPLNGAFVPSEPQDFTEKPKPIVTTNVNVDQFRDAASGATNKVEFWMNFTENQQSAFKASGLSLDELYDMVKEQAPTSEWRLPNAGNADSFAIKHDFSTHGIRFEEVIPRSDGWMADANFDGVIRVRSGGLGDDWDFIISHEAGHQLSNASPELQRLIVENPANILGRYNIKHMYFDGVYMEYNPEEAFATCVSHYVRHPESFREKYPEAYKAIDNLFTASPSAREYVENVRKAYIERFIK